MSNEAKTKTDDAPVTEPPENVGNGTRRPWADIRQDLAKPIPSRLLEQKPADRKGSQMLTYCPWHRTQKILDHYTRGFWDYQVLEREEIGDSLMMTVRITIFAEDVTLRREGTGLEGTGVSSFGDPQSNAESMAFRRACAKFGLGIGLYEGDD